MFRTSATIVARFMVPAPVRRPLLRAALAALTLAAGGVASTLRPPLARADVPAASLAAPSFAPTPFEQTIADMVNADRAAAGLQPVSFDVSLLPTARSRAATQVALPVLNHYDADGHLAFAQLLARDGVSYRLAGENLARLPGDQDVDSAARAEDALMRSPAHRANILEPLFDRLAVGASLSSDGRVILVQIFSAS